MCRLFCDFVLVCVCVGGCIISVRMLLGIKCLGKAGLLICFPWCGATVPMKQQRWYQAESIHRAHMWTPLPAAHYILTPSLIFCILLLCYLITQRTHLPQHHYDNVYGNGWFQCSQTTSWPVILSYHTYHSYCNWTQYNEICFLKHNKMAQNVSWYYNITLSLD